MITCFPWMSVFRSTYASLAVSARAQRPAVVRRGQLLLRNAGRKRRFLEWRAHRVGVRGVPPDELVLRRLYLHQLQNAPRGARSGPGPVGQRMQGASALVQLLHMVCSATGVCPHWYTGRCSMRSLPLLTGAEHRTAGGSAIRSADDLPILTSHTAIHGHARQLCDAVDKLPSAAPAASSLLNPS